MIPSITGTWARTAFSQVWQRARPSKDWFTSPVRDHTEPNRQTCPRLFPGQACSLEIVGIGGAVTGCLQQGVHQKYRLWSTAILSAQSAPETFLTAGWGLAAKSPTGKMTGAIPALVKLRHHAVSHLQDLSPSEGPHSPSEGPHLPPNPMVTFKPRLSWTFLKGTHALVHDRMKRLRGWWAGRQHANQADEPRPGESRPLLPTQGAVAEWADLLDRSFYVQRGSIQAVLNVLRPV